MRRYIKDGPELSYEVLQAHEEQRLVFFCGAGISYYTGLPGFRDLVKDACAACGHSIAATSDVALKVAFENNQFDLALHRLEQVVERPVARKILRRLLSKPIKKDGKHLRLHKALIDLASISGGARIVTTNFDDRFTKSKNNVASAEAPRLGLPRLGSWSQLTYLHGRITGKNDTCEDLILTSGDFGRAYLTEGWASRFLVELFREYTVLFIGYSLNDPVLRYVVDALATDTKEGRFRQPYVFADYAPGNEADVERQWKMKGVEPLLFFTGPDGKDFSRQEETLVRWALNHKGGLGSRVAVALDLTRRPYVKSPYDDETKNLIWALSRKDGAVARQFADATPSPHISWLEPLSASNHHIARDTAQASLLGMPSPIIGDDGKRHPHLAPLAGIGAACIPGLSMDGITYQLGRWLAKNLTEQKLVDWVIEQKGLIHPIWRRTLAEEIRHAPEPWKSFWQLVVDGATTPPCRDFFSQEHDISRGIRKGQWLDGASELLLSAAGSWLEPKKAFSFDDRDDEPQLLVQISSFSLKLRNATFLNTILRHSDKEALLKALTNLIDPLTSKLAEALRLAERAEVSQATSYSSLSMPAFPDRKEHLGDSSWTNLVYVLIESFMATKVANKEKASLVSRRWQDLATGQSLRFFRRLSAFSLHQLGADHIPNAMDFLLTNDGDVFWDPSCWPDVSRLLAMFKTASKARQRRLLQCIKQGPSRSLFPRFTGNETAFSEYAESLSRQRMAVVEQSGFDIPSHMRAFLNNVRKSAPSPKTRAADFDTSVRWIAPRSADDILDRTPSEIATLLSQESGWDAGHRLADLFRRDLNRGLDALGYLVSMEMSNDIFDISLGALGEKRGPDVSRVLDALLKIARTHSRWLGRAGAGPISRTLASLADEIVKSKERAFLELWDYCVSAAALNPSSTLLNPHNPVEEALNAPMGDLAAALLARLFRRAPKPGGGIPRNLIGRFNIMWAGSASVYRLGRVIIASRLLWLYRIDPNWVTETILPILERADDDAYDLWSGMLWQANWDIELIGALQPALQTMLPRMNQRPAEFADRIGEWLATVLVNAPQSLPEQTWFTFFASSNAEVLAKVAWVFSRYLEESKDHAGLLWQSRIKVLFKKYWPADLAKRSQSHSANLLKLAVASRDSFPDAIRVFSTKGLLIRGSASRLDFLSDLSGDETSSETYDIVAKHPQATLSALDLSVDESLESWHRDELKAILDRLESIAPTLKRALGMRRLKELSTIR